MIQTHRARNLPSLLVDAGNFGQLVGVGIWEKGSFIWDLMAELGYDAATPGDHDLMEGIDSLRALAGRHPEVRMLSANLLDRSGRRVFPESAVITRGKVRFGVTGVTDSVYHAANRKQGKVIRDDFRFEGTEEALRRVIPKLRVESDVVVVLFPRPIRRRVRRLSAAIPGIHVAIAGHDPGFLRDPERAGDAYLVRPGNRGQAMSVVQLQLDPESRKVVRAFGAGRQLTRKSSWTRSWPRELPPGTRISGSATAFKSWSPPATDLAARGGAPRVG